MARAKNKRSSSNIRIFAAFLIVSRLRHLIGRVGPHLPMLPQSSLLGHVRLGYGSVLQSFHWTVFPNWFISVTHNRAWLEREVVRKQFCWVTRISVASYRMRQSMGAKVASRRL